MLKFILTCLLALSSHNSLAAKNDFKTGPVIEAYGENALIDKGLEKPESQVFKVLFDVADKNDADGAHKSFNTVARFINMHVRAGVPLDKINVAMVVHGGASVELMSAEAYEARFEQDNQSVELLNSLIKAGVKVVLCGQSASYHEIASKDLADGVEMSLSAMTANALLQQQGFTLNPF